MNTNSEKNKRVSLYFNEDDQRAMYAYDLLQKQGRKKTKFIIDLILSNSDFSIVNQPKTKIQVVESTVNASGKSTLESPLNSCGNTTKDDPFGVTTQNDYSDFTLDETNSSDNSNDDFLSLIMSGLDAFN